MLEKYIIKAFLKDGSEKVVTELVGTIEMARAEFNKAAYPQWGESYLKESNLWEYCTLYGRDGEEISGSIVSKYTLEKNSDKTDLCCGGVPQFSFRYDDTDILHIEMFNTVGEKITELHFESATKEDCIKCKDRFIELVGNAVIKPNRALLMIDWAEIEEITARFNKGRYYHVEVFHEDEIDQALQSIKHQIKSRTDDYDLILCIDGDISLYSSYEAAKHYDEGNTGSMLMSFLSKENDSDSIDIDVWTVEEWI